MLLEAYVALDNFLLDRANDVVKVWNWTTGRTRADLASPLTISGFVSCPTSHFVAGEYPSAIILGTLFGIFALHSKVNYEEMDDFEMRALEKNTKNLEVERRKERYKIYGPLLNSLGLLNLIIPNKEGNHPWANEFHAIMGFGLGTSLYIMRTDYQAPRKNCLARAKDKLADMLRQPTTVPIQPFTPLDSQEQ